MSPGQMNVVIEHSPEVETDLADLYRRVRSHTEVLAIPLSPEDQTVQSMPDVSPTKWHRAHTSWFFETFLLRPYLPGYSEYHPAFSYLFNSYYEAVGPRHGRNERGLLSRPGVGEIAEYRSHVDEAMEKLFDMSLTPEITDLIELGINHEQQHQELLLMDIKHVLWSNPLHPSYFSSRHLGAIALDPDPNPPGSPRWIAHPGGLIEIGAYLSDGFAFDNEGPRHSVYLEPFRLCDALVTNEEWLAFIEDGGYRRPELWTSDGWAVAQSNRWEAPLYWERGEQGWNWFSLMGMSPVNATLPVMHISWYEADAYAQWLDMRLPTEAEWEVSASASGDSRRWTDSVWQWTASPYVPYPGFRTAPGAVGEYNGKFMVNQHVLRGGACITPLGHARLTYRNFFPPHARWPYTGMRLAQSS